MRVCGRVRGVGLCDVLKLVCRVLVGSVLMWLVRVCMRVVGMHRNRGLLMGVRGVRGVLGARRVMVVLRNRIYGHLLSHHPHHLLRQERSKR